MTEEQSEHEATAAEIQEHFRNALQVMDGHVNHLAHDPGCALAHLSWLGLAMMQECQRLSQHVTDEEGSERRFFSMDGALFNSTGKVMELDRQYFTVLNS